MSQFELANIINKKNLSPTLFDELDGSSLKLESNIEEHAKWVFEHIYKVPYPNEKLTQEAANAQIPRYFHGIMHVSRVATYVQVFANLYRKHGVEGASLLTDEDVKLLQIAALFHDSAREGEEHDLWDNESAILLYKYLTHVLKVPREKAKEIAEATANKDGNTEGYFEITHTDPDEITGTTTRGKPLKNIYQQIIHDADCLDIIRARPHFDATNLDFYKAIKARPEPNLAVEEMAHLITEARSLIEVEGDSHRRTNPTVKKTYESGNCYALITEDIAKGDYPLLNTFAKPLLSAEDLERPVLDLKPYNEKSGLTDENMVAALREGKIFARGIGTPSAISKKRKETFAELELRKTFREKNIPTKTLKPNRAEKQGNLKRSVSMIGFGSGVFASAGYLVVNPSIDAIKNLSGIDSDSGRGKKNLLQNKSQKLITEAEVQNLNHQLKLGGNSRTYWNGSTSTHNEILYKVTKYDAIYYSNDPNLFNEMSQRQKTFEKPLASLLQAVFLRKQYEKQYDEAKETYTRTFGNDKLFLERFGNNRTLRIFEYSSLHNRVQGIDESELTDDKLVEKWRDLCATNMRNKISSNKTNIELLSLNEIKTLSMYGLAEANVGPADSNYSDDLRQKINDAIKLEKKRIIEEYETTLINKINAGDLSILSKEAYFYLLRHPKLSEQILDLETKLQSAMNDDDLFLKKSPERFFHRQKGHNLDWGFLRDKNFSFKAIQNDSDPLLGSKKKAIWETKAARMYELAKNWGVTPICTQIQNKASELALGFYKAYEENPTASDAHTRWEEIISVFRFTQLFGLDDALAPNHKQAIETYVSQLFNNKDSCKIAVNILDMDNMGWFDKAFHSQAEAFLESYKQEIMKKSASQNTDSNFERYVKIAVILQKDPTQELITWFTHQAGKHRMGNDVLSQILSSITPYLKNIDLFSAMINAIKFKNNFSFEREKDFDLWIAGINQCEQFVEKKAFSLEQWDLIIKALDPVRLYFNDKAPALVDKINKQERQWIEKRNFLKEQSRQSTISSDTHATSLDVVPSTVVSADTSSAITSPVAVTADTSPAITSPVAVTADTSSAITSPVAVTGDTSSDIKSRLALVSNNMQLKQHLDISFERIFAREVKRLKNEIVKKEWKLGYLLGVFTNRGGKEVTIDNNTIRTPKHIADIVTIIQTYERQIQETPEKAESMAKIAAAAILRTAQDALDHPRHARAKETTAFYEKIIGCVELQHQRAQPEVIINTPPPTL